jgi:hypothetical protein
VLKTGSHGKIFFNGGNFFRGAPMLNKNAEKKKKKKKKKKRGKKKKKKKKKKKRGH